MKIAIDAMGGDKAPVEIIAGAVSALKRFDDIIIYLVGDQEIIKSKLNSYNYNNKKLKIVHASEVIDMTESPAKAVRRKKDSSIIKGLKLVGSEDVDAYISAGNTGAVMAGSLFNVKRIKGIKRPSIIINFPSINGQTIVMDNGANTDSTPENLLQFAVMGQIYAEKLIGLDNPRIGLLSIGEEKEKGNKLVKESYQLLENDKRINNFIGNVEGRDIFNGSCDLVICDGFVGNVVLKTTEGVANFMFDILKNALTKNMRAKLGALLLKPYLKELKQKTDYRQYGGAPLLGVNGVVIISHGSSDRVAISNAVKVAKETVSMNVVNLIEEKINKDGE
ncbi:MAG: phosphate acyltransferase PlsX [Halothermotrichaceae bacterium]